jgi:hypothetical protein
VDEYTANSAPAQEPVLHSQRADCGIGEVCVSQSRANALPMQVIRIRGIEMQILNEDDIPALLLLGTLGTVALRLIQPIEIAA